MDTYGYAISTDNKVKDLERQLREIDRKLNILLELVEEIQNQDTKRKTIAEKYGRKS